MEFSLVTSIHCVRVPLDCMIRVPYTQIQTLHSYVDCTAKVFNNTKYRGNKRRNNGIKNYLLAFKLNLIVVT